MIYDNRWHDTKASAIVFAKRLSRVNQDLRFVIESRSTAGHSKWCVDKRADTRKWERVVAVFDLGQDVTRPQTRLYSARDDEVRPSGPETPDTRRVGRGQPAS